MKKQNILKGSLLFTLGAGFVFGGSAVAFADTTEANNTAINIPDAELKKCINNQISASSQNDKGKLDDIYPEEIEHVRFLSCDNNAYVWEGEERPGKIKDLTGLEAFTDLKNASFKYNEISDITPIVLSNITNAKLDNNEISDISPLANSKTGISLTVSGNKIADFSSIKNLNNQFLDATDQKLDLGNLKPGQCVDKGKDGNGTALATKKKDFINPSADGTKLCVEDTVTESITGEINFPTQFIEPGIMFSADANYTIVAPVEETPAAVEETPKKPLTRAEQLRNEVNNFVQSNLNRR